MQQGLINNTWKLNTINKNYIVQKINKVVFINPFIIADNINTIQNYLKKINSDLQLAFPLETLSKQYLFIYEEEYYRVIPFVENAVCINVVENEKQAFEAAFQFGKFTAQLVNLDCSKLKNPIPSFHDLSLRYQQFTDALKNGNNKRINECKKWIALIDAQKNILLKYEKIKNNLNFKLRVTHHDTKISNILFTKTNESLCVIDLDTVMPGYFISDFGDMVRTYICPVSEEETNFSKITIRKEFYFAIVNGYNKPMKNILTTEEKNHFFYAGTFMIYMQAIRFLTDYINDDIYYATKYENHNLNRAINQLTLLQKLNAERIVLENYKPK